MTDTITKEEFIAWLKTKPADGTYDYCATRNCAVAQFLKSRGKAVFSVGPTRWTEGDDDYMSSTVHQLPRWLIDAQSADIQAVSLSGTDEHTFGGLLKAVQSV